MCYSWSNRFNGYVYLSITLFLLYVLLLHLFIITLV